MYKVTSETIISQDIETIDKFLIYYQEQIKLLNRYQYVCNYNIDAYQQARADRINT